MKTLLDCLFVALGGAIGSVSRFLLGKLPVKAAGFPVITLGINVVGAFCIGLIVAAVGAVGGIREIRNVIRKHRKNQKKG